jgi:hypothetical protein
MPFTANVGKTDRIIRIIIAILLFIISIVISGWLRIILIIIGIMLLITTITRFCGLYKLLGINTCKFNPKSQ